MTDDLDRPGYSCDECGAWTCACDAEYDDDRDCYWCAGDGWQECPDPIECTSPHNKWGECRCGSCGGSGLAKDMTIW